MRRTAVVIVLGIALAFAALPGVIALSFAGGSSTLSEEVATRLDAPADTPGSTTKVEPLAMGVSEPHGGCDTAPEADASRF